MTTRRSSSFSRSQNHREWQEGPVIIKNIQRQFSRSWRNLGKREPFVGREAARSFKAAIWQAFF